MEFRLTYSGPLCSTGNDSILKGDRRSDHKHDIRMKFHPQLKRLWEITPFLKSGRGSSPDTLTLISNYKEPPNYKATYLAKKFALYGWNFVPLVSKNLELMCGIDILFLRPHHPGGIINQGDIDGRLKTLLDALSIPDANQGYESRGVAEGEKKLIYALLENDRLLTKVSVETDQLLEIDESNYDVNEVKLVITVRLRPYEMQSGNMQFG